jgi:cell division septal protein FtsQ
MKLGNRRRKKNEYLLDVKVQTEGRLRHRARWLSAILAALAVLSLSAFGVYRLVKFSAAKMVHENPRFAIVQIVVDNDGALTPEQVVNFAGVAVGQNLLSLNLDQVRRNLEMLPLVRHAEVRRLLPQKLIIHVEERVAVARLRGPSRELSDTDFFVDRSGFVMKPIQLTDGAIVRPQTVGPIPTLTGVSLADVRVGKQVQSEQVYRALELLDRMQQASAGAMMEIETIDLSKARHLTLTSRQRTTVKFDIEEYAQQLRRLSAILTWAAQRQRIVASVDLTVARGVPVAFAN